MVGLDYVINLIDKSFSGGMKKAKKNTEGLDQAVGKTNKGIGSLKGSSKQGFGSVIKWAKRAAIATGLVFAIGQVQAFGTEITNQAAKFEGYENAIRFASGADGAKNIHFLNKTIKSLNLDMASSFEGFQTLTGSLKGTSLEGKATRDIFDAVGVAATTMNLTADQSKGAFLAIGQMASKGKVQAEELRGQLGERIPGALGIAARSMGMSQIEFNKMLDSGKVYAEDFLPKFAKELKKTFEGGLPAAANSMQSAINKKNNALVSFKKSFGDNMKPAIIGILNLKSQFFGFLEEFLPKLNPILSSVVNLGNAFKPLTDRLFGLSTAMGGTEGFANGLKDAINGIAIGVEIAAEGIVYMWDTFHPLIKAIGAAVAVQWAFNIALAANPVGLVIAGITLLAGGIIYAYKKVGWFRGGIMATWETLKGFGGAIKTYVIDRFKQMISGLTGIATAFKHFWNGDWQKGIEAGKESMKNLLGTDAKKNLVDNLKQTGINAGKAYADGLEQAKANNVKKDNLFDITSKTTSNNIVKGTATENSNTNALAGGNTNSKKQTLSGSASGGTASKNITFKIESIVKELKIQPQTLKEGMIDVEKQVKDIFIRMIRDVETQAQF